MKQAVLMIGSAMLLSACQSSYQTTVAQIQADQSAREVSKLSAVARADKKTSEARGTKKCHIKQYTSAHLVKKRIELKQQTGYSIGSEMSEVFVKVDRSGAVSIAVTDDTYPGTNAFFLIEGRRYKADGDEYASIDASGLAALKRDAVIKFSWTNWPYRNEVNREDVLAGFSAAYEDCLQFLRS